jgi:hypothetical protein
LSKASLCQKESEWHIFGKVLPQRSWDSCPPSIPLALPESPTLSSAESPSRHVVLIPSFISRQRLAEEILGQYDNDHNASLTFDEFIPWFVPHAYTHPIIQWDAWDAFVLHAHTHPLLRAFDNSVHPGMRWPWKKKERPDEVTNGLTASTSLRSSRAEWLVPSGPSAAITSAMPCLCMLLATWTQ